MGNWYSIWQNYSPKRQKLFSSSLFLYSGILTFEKKKKNSNHVPILQKKDITMLLCCRKIFKCKSLPSLVCPSNQLEWNQNWRIIQCAIEPSLDYSEYKKLKNGAHILVQFGRSTTLTFEICCNIFFSNLVPTVKCVERRISSLFANYLPSKWRKWGNYDFCHDTSKFYLTKNIKMK